MNLQPPALERRELVDLHVGVEPGCPLVLALDPDAVSDPLQLVPTPDAARSPGLAPRAGGRVWSVWSKETNRVLVDPPPGGSGRCSRSQSGKSRQGSTPTGEPIRRRNPSPRAAQVGASPSGTSLDKSRPDCRAQIRAASETCESSSKADIKSRSAVEDEPQGLDPSRATGTGRRPRGSRIVRRARRGRGARGARRRSRGRRAARRGRRPPPPCRRSGSRRAGEDLGRDDVVGDALGRGRQRCASRSVLASRGFHPPETRNRPRRAEAVEVKGAGRGDAGRAARGGSRGGWGDGASWLFGFGARVRGIAIGSIRDPSQRIANRPRPSSLGNRSLAVQSDLAARPRSRRGAWSSARPRPDRPAPGSARSRRSGRPP